MNNRFGALALAGAVLAVMIGCQESSFGPTEDPLGPPALAIHAPLASSPLVEYDFNNVTPFQGAGVPAPPSSINAAAVTASVFSIVQAFGAPCDFGPTGNVARNGVNIIGSSQHMSFVLGHLKFCNPNLPTRYPSFEFSLTSLIGPIRITSISFLAGTNPTNTAEHPTGQPIASIIEYRTPAGPVGSDAFSWFRGFPTGGSGDAALAVTVTPTGLVLSGQPTTFKLRFNQIITGESFTTQVRIEDVEVKGVALVDIDIKPGSDPSSWDCRDVKRELPVALLSTTDFDATTVDAESVRFGKDGTEAAEVHKKKEVAKRHVEDVNKDGLLDMVFHFRFGDTGFSCDDIPAGEKSFTLTGTLTGETQNGTAIEGEDNLRLVNQ